MAWENTLIVLSLYHSEADQSPPESGRTHRSPVELAGVRPESDRNKGGRVKSSSFRFVFYFHLFCLLIVALMFISICHRVSPVSQLYFIYRQCCTLAGLHPFLLGSPARCANYCSLLCQIYLFR